MSRFRKYHTGMTTTDYNYYPKPPYVGKNFRIILGRKDPMRREINELGSACAREIIIRTTSHKVAQHVCNMLYGSLCLATGIPPLFDDIPTVVPFDRNEKKEIEQGLVGPLRVQQMGTSNIPLACMIAAKTSFRRFYCNALTKFYFSSTLHSNWIVDLDPSHSGRIPLSSYPGDYVRYAYAIIISYSVVEELGLEIRASKENPSFRNGQWNNDVKVELENRLRKNKVKLDENVSWNLRGTPTKIERLRPPRAISKASWAYGNVRDCELNIIDAIAYISWLRSKISSHRLTKLVSRLSVYDVANAQILARRLFLEKLGFWRWDKYNRKNLKDTILNS